MFPRNVKESIANEYYLVELYYALVNLSTSLLIVTISIFEIWKFPFSVEDIQILPKIFFCRLLYRFFHVVYFTDIVFQLFICYPYGEAMLINDLHLFQTFKYNLITDMLL
jgi:hypothetical protein